MNLTEYLNQIEVKRRHNVKLELSEVIIWRNGLHYYVSIPQIEQRFKINGIYRVEENGASLYTIDQDGNKKSLSCFCLNFNPNDLKNI